MITATRSTTTAVSGTKPTTEVTTAIGESDQIAALQHAFNALSTAAWHTARGDVGAAMARIRRATAHLKTSGVQP